MKKICILLFIYFHSSHLKADIEVPYNFFQNGEKKTVDYQGPKDPRAIYSVTNGKLLLLDSIYKENFFNKNFSEEIFNLNHFWVSELREKSICPNEELFGGQEYIHYLFRLSSMSYLFEAMKLSFKTSSEFGFDLKQCQLNFENVLGACSPKSSDMKKFHQRAYGKFLNDIGKMNFEKLSKNEIDKKIAEIRKTNSLTMSLINQRLYTWCGLNNVSCRKLTLENINKALGEFCNRDLKKIHLICSEEDSYYGFSNVETLSNIIKNSSAFNLVNQNGTGEDCLRRFVKMNQAKELVDDELAKLFPMIYISKFEEKNRYKEGELFLPGALKEFDMKGLSDFLVALKPPVKEAPVVKIKPKPVLILKAKPKQPERVEVKVEKVEPIVKVEEPKTPKISEFERVVLEIQVKGLKSLSLDMDKFLSDYEFSKEKLESLTSNMKKFQTRKALVDMKAYDHLGGIDAPVGLIFLRYLLATENHQGLYNVQSVLGNKFYVYNDVEKIDMPRLVELKNDASTGNRWQIIVIKDP